MKPPALVRRRTLWVPTIWGLLLILALLVGCSVLTLRRLHGFLSPVAPLQRGVLVVEGWIDEAGLGHASEIWARGHHDRLITTGGPIERGVPAQGPGTHAEVASAALGRRGVPAAAIHAVPSPASAQDRTFLSAVSVRDWLAEREIRPEAIDVISGGPHARRSRWLYRRAFGEDVPIGILATPPADYDPRHWWRSSAGAEAVVTELVGYVWTRGFFRPGDRGSHRERWGIDTPRPAPPEVTSSRDTP